MKRLRVRKQLLGELLGEALPAGFVGVGAGGIELRQSLLEHRDRRIVVFAGVALPLPP